VTKAEEVIIRFLVSQCRKCKGQGESPSHYIDAVTGQWEGVFQCPDCRELRELLKAWEPPK